MEILQAVGRLASRRDRSIVPCRVTYRIPITNEIASVWPAFACALASLSGALEDAGDDASLDEAISAWNQFVALRHPGFAGDQTRNSANHSRGRRVGAA
jgi:hypothetical protein